MLCLVHILDLIKPLIYSWIKIKAAPIKCRAVLNADSAVSSTLKSKFQLNEDLDLDLHVLWEAFYGAPSLFL